MATEYIIGRNPSSPIKIPSGKIEVSGQHIKITIQNEGKVWLIEDLGSPNGTFIRDEKGDFKKIYSKKINKTDIIRLGSGGANSFTFMARRVVNPDDSYEYEFKHLRKQLALQKEQEQKKERRIEINGWISKFSGIAVIGICAIIGSIKGVTIDPNLRYILIACAPVAMGLILNPQTKALKNLKKNRQKFMICPHCGSPVSDFDVERGQCSRCNAK